VRPLVAVSLLNARDTVGLLATTGCRKPLDGEASRALSSTPPTPFVDEMGVTRFRQANLRSVTGKNQLVLGGGWALVLDSRTSARRGGVYRSPKGVVEHGWMNVLQ